MAPARILVTGGIGFVGTAILRAAHEQHPEWQLFSLDIKPPPVVLPYVEYLTADLTAASETDAAFRTARPDCVVATAGVVPPLGDRYARRLQKLVYATNVDGIEVSRDAPVALGEA